MAKLKHLLLLVQVSAFMLSCSVKSTPDNQASSPESSPLMALRSNKEWLNNGFKWAQYQAKAYVQDEAPVGKWYEAGLPGRGSFCMRDVSHQIVGAHFLGLDNHTTNMLQKFAANISESRDWCSYWEITRDNRPTPVDYTSDDDFWYNLPANFDVMRACFQMYVLTGEEVYIQDPVFQKFYAITVNEYVRQWDSNADGLLDSPSEKGRRGLGSYYEDAKERIFTGADLVAAQYAGYTAMSSILEASGKDGIKWTQKADSLANRFDQEWWDREQNAYYPYLKENGEMASGQVIGIQILSAYFGLIKEEARLQSTLDLINKGGMNVEENSYLADVYYQYERDALGTMNLKANLDPFLNRKTYPEVSFAAVGNVLNGLLGIRPNAPENILEIKPRLSYGVEEVELNNLAVWNALLDVYFYKNTTITIKVKKGSFKWQPVFKTEVDFLWVNGVKTPTFKRVNIRGKTESYVTLWVKQTEKYTVSMHQ